MFWLYAKPVVEHSHHAYVNAEANQLTVVINSITLHLQPSTRQRRCRRRAHPVHRAAAAAAAAAAAGLSH